MVWVFFRIKRTVLPCQISTFWGFCVIQVAVTFNLSGPPHKWCIDRSMDNPSRFFYPVAACLLVRTPQLLNCGLQTELSWTKRPPAASRLTGPTESSCLRRASVSLGWTLSFNLLLKEALLPTQRGTSAVPDHSSSTRSVALVRNPLCRTALRNKCLYQRKKRNVIACKITANKMTLKQLQQHFTEPAAA